MTDDQPRQPRPKTHFKDRALADLEARRAREAAALRANLHRRKAQLRQRAEQDVNAPPDDTDEPS